MKASEIVQVANGDYLETLKRCGGFYQCPKDKNGRRLGPLVGYAKTYLDELGKKLQYVGDIYANFATAEEYPQVMLAFAKELATKVRQEVGEVDYVVAAPMGGITLAVHMSSQLDCRYVFAEKKITTLGTETLREQSSLEFLRHSIEPGSRVLLVEDVCNNFSTADDLIGLVEKNGSNVVAIGCALNRSGSDHFTYHKREVPVVGVILLDQHNYRQDDPAVAEDMAQGNVVLKPKNDWSRLMGANGS